MPRGKCHEFVCTCKKHASREPHCIYCVGDCPTETPIANIDRAAFATCTRTAEVPEVSEGWSDSRDRISGGPGARRRKRHNSYT